MSKILRFGALLCVLFFTGNAFAAGYSCPTYKKYTSCSAGYYMTSSSSSTACNTSAVAGNACRPCSAYGSNYSCAGGTACPQPTTITVSCSAGKYIPSGSTSCSTTCPANYWCAGGSYTIPASGATSNTGVTGACSGTYPYADSGSSSQNNCYKNNTKSGSQVAPSLPTGCGAQTTNACTPGTCTYRTYYNGSTTSCTPSNCTQTHKACTSANANYYLASGVAKTCSSANSSYPSSAGGNITSSSCYGSFTKSGSQLDPSMPTGCAARSLSACTPGTCTFTRYASGTIKSDCTPTNCTKGQTCTSASANYYLASGVAKTCSSYSSTYTQSDGGNISNAYCYISRTKTGSQLNGSTPSNCYSVTAWNACTPGTCTYKDYASATDTTCTPSNCTKTVKSVSANANYYVSGTSCVACSGLASGFYPNSSAGNTGGASACKTNSLAGKYVASANASSATNCGAGKYKASHQVAYGSTSSCNTASAGYYAPGTTSSSQTQCVAGSYSTGGASACTACGAGKTSSAGATSTSACTSCSAITNINSWASSSWNSNNTMSNLCTVSTCNGSSYKSGNSCPSCPSGYTANTSTGKTSISQCQISVAAGKYVGTANSASLSSCAAGTYRAAHTVSYGSTSSCSACTGATYSGAGAGSCSSCPSGYTANTTSNKTSASQCQISVAAGKYVGTANSATLSTCAAGTAKAAHTVNYGSTSSCSACTGATYSGSGASSCSSCPSGYTANTSSNKTSASQCQISVAAGKYVGTANTTTLSSCAAGTYKGAHNVNYGSTSSCAACTGATYSGAGAGSCSSCPSGYTANTASNKTAASQCQISVAGGKYIAKANESAASGTCAAGTYKGAHTVNYGSTSSCSSCSGRTQYSAAGASSCSTVSSGYYTTGCNSSNNNCTGQSQCTGTTYCTGGVAHSCPDATANKRTTFPANYYNPVLSSASLQAATGNSSISQCRALSWWESSRGVLYEYATYNTSTSKYDTSGGYGWSDVKPGYYLTTKAGCGTYAYYSEAKDCPANSYCPGKSKVVCNSSNQATVHTTNFGLESCPSAYPNSAANSTAITSCYSGTKSRAWTGSQLDGAVPTNCSKVTAWNACSVGACQYTAYSNSTGTGDGTVKSGCSTNNASCTKTVKSVAAKSGYYVSGTSCSACSGLASGFYPNSATDNTGGASACYTASLAGKYVATANATSASTCAAGTYKGSHTVKYGATSSCSACSGRTQYSAAGASACSTVSGGYYTTGCNSSNNNCTGQSQCTGTTYCSGGVQNSCPSGYTANTTAGKTTATQCAISIAGGKYLATANSATATNCAAGSYKAAHTVNYGSTSSCSACPSGYTVASGSGTVIGNCYISIAAGKYLGTANGTTASTCAAGTYKAAHNVNYGSTSSCAACTGATYSAAGAGSCSSCPSGYTANTTSNKTAASQCQISVAAGKYVGTANSATLSSCAAGTAKAAHSVNYGSTSSCAACTGATYSGAGAGSCTACPSGYTANTSSNKTSASQCQISVAAGKYVGTANTTTLSSCAAGTYKGAHNVNYGSTSSCAACTGATYSAAGAASCASCPTGYTANTTSNKTAVSQCQISVAGGKYIATANESAASGTCAAGTYKAAHTVNYGSTSSCSVCAANNYSDAGAAACSACATANGYTNTGTTAAAHAGIASCKATCSGAQYVATAGAGCVSVGAGYWGAGGTVAQNATLARTQCPAGYRDGAAVSAQSSCAMNVPAKYYLKTANDSAPTICAGGTWNAAHTKTYGQTSTCNACPTGYASGAAASAQSACQMSVAAGKHVATANDSTATNCAANTYRAAHAVNYGATSTCTSCPSGYSVASGAGTAKNSCKITCGAGAQVAAADAACTTPAGSWYTAAHTVAAGSVSGSNVKACLTNYATANTTTATDHDAASDCKISCAAGTRIAAANATSCTTPAGNWYVGAHTVSQGSASSVNNCLANYTISGTAATNHDAENDCKITCGGGMYIAAARNTSCSNVGSGYWAAAATVSQGNAGTRNACAAGLTTIGFGTGADEEDDCGRVLNIGADKIYLRSAKKTSPSLNVGINGTTYYGNMGTAAKGTLRIQSGSTTYSVYDDSI